LRRYYLRHDRFSRRFHADIFALLPLITLSFSPAFHAPHFSCRQLLMPPPDTFDSRHCRFHYAIFDVFAAAIFAAITPPPLSHFRLSYLYASLLMIYCLRFRRIRH